MRVSMSAVRSLSAATLILAFCAASSDSLRAQSTPPDAVTGTIVARDTGQPIVGATVTREGSTAEAVTNGLGRFEIPGAGPAAALTVRASGFVERRVSDVERGTAVRIELDPTPNFMDRVQVTASKVPLNVGDLAAAPPTIISRQTIDQRGDQRLTEAVEHVPGALITTELGIFESVLFRGMPRVGNEFTNTLLLVDGVPQTNAGNDARVVALPIYDTSSVEAVRGPNSALYGRTAIGGAINVITADPAPRPEFTVDLAGGMFGTAKGVVSASGPIQNWGGYYASVGKFRTGGYYDNLLDTDFRDENTSFFGKLKFVPDPKGFGSVTINRVSSNNSTPTNEPIMNDRLLHEVDPDFPRLTSFNLPQANYYQGETRLTFNYARQLSNRVRLVEVFGYRDVQRDFFEDGDFIGTPYSLENQTVTMYPFNQQTEDHNLYEEARVELTGAAGRMKQSLIAGGSYERNSGNSAYDGLLTDEETFGFPDFSYVHPVVPDRSLWRHDQSAVDYMVGITGLFGQYLLEPADRIVVTLGGRYDHLALDATQGSGAPVDATYDAFSPKIGATVRLLGAGSGTNAPALNAYGNYAQAFLPPRRPSALQAADTELNLKPEDIANYEAGLKGSLFDSRLALEASYFHMTEDGVVINKFVNNRFVPSNAGELRYNGVETGATWTAGRKASFYANASFYRHRYGDFVIEDEDGDVTLTGNHLVLSPSYIVNWGANIQVLPAVGVVFDVKHVSATYGNETNTARIEGYTLFDVAATWQRGPVRVTLSGRNLFDQDYYFNASDETADPAPPRQILLSTTIRLHR